MNAPFALPVEWTGTHTDVLIDANHELIAEVEAATDAERAYIAHCVNQHDRLAELLKRARFYLPESNLLAKEIDEALKA